MTALYIIERDFGKLGTEFSGDREHTLRGVIDDIVTGQTDNVIRVLEIHIDENRCQDVTEDVARAVRDRIVNESLSLDWDMANWLHSTLGVNSIAWPVAAE